VVRARRLRLARATGPPAAVGQAVSIRVEDDRVLRATCALSNKRDLVEVTVRSGDPVVPALPGAAYDSKLEERFARDFAKVAARLEVIREPEVVPLGNSWTF
jgi:anti-sigma factor RsiW